MVTSARRLLHYTAYAPSRVNGAVPWRGSLSRYATELRDAGEAQPNPSARKGLTQMASRLERLAAFDSLYQLDLQKRKPGLGYADFVKDADRRNCLEQCLDALTQDQALWRDLTAPAPEGAGLEQNHLLALLDRIHPWDQGVFQATTPAVPLWWHGQPGLLHAFAPAVDWVEDGLARMAASGKFPLEQSRRGSGQQLLFRGMKSFQDVFPEGVPSHSGSTHYAMAFQSCAMQPQESFAVKKQGTRDHELVIDPQGVPAVNMNRLIAAAFSTSVWTEAMLPIASSGLQIQDRHARDAELSAQIAEAVRAHYKTLEHSNTNHTNSNANATNLNTTLNTSTIFARSNNESIHSLEKECIRLSAEFDRTKTRLTTLDHAYSELKNLCVWTKTNGGMGSLYRSQHELLPLFKLGTSPHVNNVELGKHGRWRGKQPPV